MASAFTAVYDACVLYPAPLRDLLLRLGAAGFFRARWSNEINDEWSRNLRQNRPDIPVERITALVDLVNRSVPDCLVTGHENLVGGLQLPDPDDRHVLAAAIRAGAGVIVTYNSKDFPEPELAKYGIEVQHPDTFVLHLLDLLPGPVTGVVKEQRAALRSPPRSAEELLATLQQLQLVATVSQLREMINLI